MQLQYNIFFPGVARKLLDVCNINLSSLFPHRNQRNVERYRCPYCNYSTDRTTSFKNHQLVHSGERPYKCHVCSFGFTTKQNLRRHLPLHNFPNLN
ncbi:hypothetical protein JTE90_011629 [Oedothorax gibbosus]|uniref:C2H2-type domain-containing protein n=1 Tax=Oedothorax gibbosus TaxID=931172 RepID=A0AAV6U4G4_9ARAC|nr:hypothetical protein JTE90_011629 [Oedothorax gibbosus]